MINFIVHIKLDGEVRSVVVHPIANKEALDRAMDDLCAFVELCKTDYHEVEVEYFIINSATGLIFQEAKLHEAGIPDLA